ncbi:MAG TPA: hypothetical protein VL137_00895 [Polyangiaceae bacterium]|nr:hypothetical protein [Polyangiaceae bacterium]
MRALDELLNKWRKNPDAQLTLALCSHLGGSEQEDLIREIGVAAETWHRRDLKVMLGVGRMYLDSGLLSEAQAALVAAGKVDPNESSPYRYLGEVLLRRGDAARSEKVLARAIELGRTDDETKLWHDRALVYMGLQKRVGAEAVAEELGRTLPRTNSIPAPALPRSNDLDVDQEQVSTQRGANADVAKPRISSLPPPPVPPRTATNAVASAAAQQLGHPSARPVAAAGAPHPGPQAARARPLPSPHGGTLMGLPAPPPPAGMPFAQQPAPLFAHEAPVPAPRTAQESALILAPPVAATGQAQAQVRVNNPLPQIPQAPAVPKFAPPPAAPRAAELWAQPGGAATQQQGGHEMPDADLVMQQLASAGVYDTQVTSSVPWEAPRKQRPRGLLFLMVALGLVLAGGFGFHQYQIMVRERELAEAQSLCDEVNALLCQGTPQSLQASEAKFKRIFELDSTNQRAAVLWLRNRALAALVLDQEPSGIAGAINRLEVLKAPAEQIAVGRVASSLIEGDLPGAAATMGKFDATASGDAFYQLVSGVVLDRAGDAAALVRYRKAVEIEPKLTLAQVLAAQLALLQRVPESKAVLDTAKAQLGNSPAGKALAELEWDLGARDTELPSSAVLSSAESQALPRLLRAVPLATTALQQLAQGSSEAGVNSLTGAIHAAGSPQVCTWLGFLALDIGKPELARSAALQAMRFSAVYSGARILAARVAVSGARLDEAKKAIEGMDPSDPDVAVVHAAAAYEGLDASTLEDMGSRLDAGKRPNVAALAGGVTIILGKKYPSAETLQKWASPSMIYGDVIALDALLDKGDLNAAQKVMVALGDRANTPAMAVRHARLLRYQGKVKDAVNSADSALRDGAPTQRALIESVYALIEASNTGSAKDLITRYPAVLGTSASWLAALVDSKGSNAHRAKTSVAALEPFPSDAPLILRVLAARTLASVADRRAKGGVAPLMRAFGKNPDVVVAAKAVGLAR